MKVYLFNKSRGIILNGFKKSYDPRRLAFDVVRFKIERFK